MNNRIHDNYNNKKNKNIDIDNKLSLTIIKDTNIKQYVMSYDNKNISYTINKEECSNLICKFGVEHLGVQIRLNLFILNNYDSGFIDFIKYWEDYFSKIYSNKYTFQSIIHNNDKYDSKIILHLKKNRKKIITNLNSNNTGKTWFDLEKEKQFYIYGIISINCLWINNDTNTFGLSFEWNDVTLNN